MRGWEGGCFPLGNFFWAIGGGAGQRVGGGGPNLGGSWENKEEKSGIPFGGLGAWPPENLGV